jgi:hypothetical protein
MHYGFEDDDEKEDEHGKAGLCSRVTNHASRHPIASCSVRAMISFWRSRPMSAK